MKLTVSKPVRVYRRPLSATIDGNSVKPVTDIIRGKVPLIPDMLTGETSVRDAARLNLNALTAGRAAGKRFTGASFRPVPTAMAAGILKNEVYSKVLWRKATIIVPEVPALPGRKARMMLPLPGRRISPNRCPMSELRHAQTAPVDRAFKEMTTAIAA